MNRRVDRVSAEAIWQRGRGVASTLTALQARGARGLGRGGRRGGIAVGTPITERPPHRSEHAQLTHSAPTLGV